MTSRATSEQLRGLLAEIDALRETLRERRQTSAYPWDPSPLEAYHHLRERARAFLPEAPVHPPTPDQPLTGGRLWRTPTDDALQALEELRAAIATAIKAAP